MSSSTRTSRVRRIALTLALAATAAIGVTSSAGAADKFSPFFPTQTATLGDCRIYIGPVYTGATPYKVVGGFHVNCTLRHSFITATVSEAYAQDYVHYWHGGYRSASVSYSHGFGPWILKTGGFCALHGSGYWYTSATVSISGVGTQTFYSSPKVAYGACST
jgi:hypothetical protein